MTETEALKAIHVEARRFCGLDEADDVLTLNELVGSVQLMGECSRRWTLVYNAFRGAEEPGV